MATFEELQNNWRSQPVSAAEDPAAMQERFLHQWKKQQRGVLWSNIATTAGFIGASCVIVWVLLAFREGHSIFFSGSIFFMLTLMLVYLGVIWKGTSFKKSLNVADQAYIDHYLETLVWRRKTMTHYTLIYTIMLWLALMCYMYDLFASASPAYQVGGPLVTTLYIFGVYFITKRTKVKKKVKELDELIGDLRKLSA